ncbi:MAG: aspartate carbamoyltransferase catalytic subunit [Aliishimia sp.]
MSDEWAGILDADERIVWQGSPAPGLRLEWESPILPLFFTVFTGFSIFWMAIASMAGGFFWMFGLLFFGAGMYNLVGVHFWKAYLRRKTFYTLSNKRAFIATNAGRKRQLASYPIVEATTLELQFSGPKADIYFAKETKKTNNGTYEIAIGFEHIENGQDVYALMREVQVGTA